ncbi:hypothetical protein WBG78_08605 [Chryseolinea sp. T2]|uniref:hypothetical protein n=1 Tax=Chryseolinea sp. T2 TaxID=3129255 RepID=UPI003077FCD4
MKHTCTLVLFACLIFLASCKEDEVAKQEPETPIAVTTLAGSAQGLKDGVGTDAQFYYPSKLALAASGDVYVIDQDGTAVRKISSNGSVSTILASHPKKIVALVIGKDGTIYIGGESWIGKLQQDGTVEVIANAPDMSQDVFFYRLTSMEMLPDGSLILFEMTNHRVINITTTGKVISVLCNHPFGYEGGDRNGKLRDIYFAEVYDMFVTSAGEVYFTDWFRHDLRKISTDKVVTTVVGTDYATPFSFPMGVTRSKEGVLYLVEKDRIVKVDEAGNYQTFAGGIPGYLDANGASAQFWNPFDVLLSNDEHTMYVADCLNNRIRKVTF